MIAQNISPSAEIVYTKGECSTLSKARTSMQQSFDVNLGFVRLSDLFQLMSFEDHSECGSLVESSEYGENGNRSRPRPFPLTSSGTGFSPSTDSLGVKSSRSSSPSHQKRTNTPSLTIKSKTSAGGLSLLV